MASKENHLQKEVHPEAFLNGAKQYGKAGDILAVAVSKTGLSQDPVCLLYFHATELALKAFLAFKGEKTESLKHNWKHNLEKLLDKAMALDLAPDTAQSQDIRNVVSLLHSGNREEAFRYFTWEPRLLPELQWAGKVVNNLVGLVDGRTNFTKGEPGPPVKIDLVVGQPTPIGPILNRGRDGRDGKGRELFDRENNDSRPL